jgi:hypothetical protein
MNDFLRPRSGSKKCGSCREKRSSDRQPEDAVVRAATRARRDASSISAKDMEDLRERIGEPNGCSSAPTARSPTLRGCFPYLRASGLPLLGGSTSAAGAWSAVTIGRVLFAAVERWLAARTTYRILPFLLAATFLVIAFLPDGATAAGIAAFAVAGLGCSALLPLTIGFGQEELATMAAALAGGVIAFYQVGYGIAAFGVGPILDGGVSLPAVYGFSAIVAVAMGIASFGVTRVAKARGAGAVSGEGAG